MGVRAGKHDRGKIVYRGNFVRDRGDVDGIGFLAALTRAKSELRRQLNRMISLKFSPELHFQIDDTFDRMDDTRRMLGDTRVQRDLAED